jgi:hypothetical protein
VEEPEEEAAGQEEVVVERIEHPLERPKVS